MTRGHVALPTLAVSLLVATGVRAQWDDFSDVKIKTTHVAGKVHMLEGRGGNVGASAGSDGVLIVDDQYGPLAEKILDALRELGGDSPKFILNTHWHGDHVGGNEEFGKGAPIIAHTNVRRRLATTQELLGRSVEPRSKEALPVITFEDSLTVHFNGEEILVVHLPGGHTDGDSVIFFTKSNVVHMGDLMFAGRFPFVDLEHGGDVEGLTKNIAKVLAELKPGAKIIPGHGPLSTRADLETYHRMMVETTELVRTAMAAGKSLGEIKATGLPAKWNGWGDGFIKTDFWLETIHKSLSRGPE